MPTTGHLEDYIDALPEEMTPDLTNDMMLMRKDSDGSMEKISLNSIASAGGGDVSYLALLADQLINEIKGWPPIVNTGDLDALNLWFDKLGTPTTAPSVQDTSAAGITDNYELCIKVVTDAASEGLFQRFTYANEPRVKAGRRLSTLWAIWCVGGVGVTLSLLNQTAEETAAAKVTAAAWTIVEVPNHLLAGTYVDIILKTDGAGTFYAVPLGANIGSRGLPLKPRGGRYIDKDLTAVVNGVDPGGADFTDADCTNATSNLAYLVNLLVYYSNNNTGFRVGIRRNGSVEANGLVGPFAAVASQGFSQTEIVSMDDGQVIEYKTDDSTAGHTEVVSIFVKGYWEWE